MTPGPRGGETVERLARQIAGEYGMPLDRAEMTVQQVFRAVREDLLSAEVFVIPGVLVVERRPEGSRKFFRVRLVLRSSLRSKLRMAARRARQRSGG